jgi:hypothetical protein
MRLLRPAAGPLPQGFCGGLLSAEAKGLRGSHSSSVTEAQQSVTLPTQLCQLVRVKDTIRLRKMFNSKTQLKKNEQKPHKCECNSHSAEHREKV